MTANAPTRTASPRHAVVVAQLRALRRRLQAVSWAERTFVLLTVMAVVLIGMMLLDWHYDLEREYRAMSLAVGTFAFAILLAWSLAPLFHFPEDHESLALRAEQRHGGFGGRLIAATQLGGGDESHSPLAQTMVDSLVNETAQQTLQSPLSQLVDLDFFWKSLLSTSVIAMCAAAVYWTYPDQSTALVQRAFLADVSIPRNTRIVESTGDAKIGIGDDLELSFHIAGVQPAAGELFVHFPSQSKQLTLIQDAADSTHYTVTLENIQESFTYRAIVNDARSDRFHVRALPRPTVESLDVTQVYPSYTELTASRHAPGDFRFLRGSQLRFDIHSSAALESARIRWIGSVLETDCRIDASDATIFTAKFTLPSDADTTKWNGFAVSMTDRKGMRSSDETVYRMTLVADLPPATKILYPLREQDTATRKARLLLEFQAMDDFGIDQVQLHYTVNGGETSSLPIRFSPDNDSRTAQTQHEWRLDQVITPLKQGDEVAYWVAVTDNHPNHQIGNSKRRRLRIVPDATKRAELLRRAADQLRSLQAVTDDQETLNEELGEVLRGNQ